MSNESEIKFKNITFSEKTEKNKELQFENLENKNNTFRENSNIFKKVQKYEKISAIKFGIKSTNYSIILNVNLMKLVLTLCYVALMARMIQDGCLYVNKITTELIFLNLLLFLLNIVN